jgi:circadian clock protein KaiC
MSDLHPMRRMPTGVPGLDSIIEGGLLSGGVYMVQGPPGAGKTILANQICYHHARDERTVYVTLLAESHARMIGHLRRMAFYRGELVGDALVYHSGYKVLQSDGLAGLARMLRSSVAERSASLLVVDGIVTAGEIAHSPQQFKEFVHEVQTFSSHLGCTTLLLSSSDSPGVQAEQTIVDGILELSDDLNGLRSLRHVQVRKMRGTHQIRGRHTVEITDQGIIVHARFEAGLDRNPGTQVPGGPRRAFGIEKLDRMLSGGVPSGSVTMLLGPSGSGKTTLQLQFLSAGAANGERVLYFGFYEHPAALLAKCKRIHIGLQAGVDAGLIELVWERPIEGVLDVLANRLIEKVRETGASRLCIDGLHTLFRTVDFPERMRPVTAALAEELESHGVTTLYSLETPDLVGAQGGAIRVPLEDLSALAHNVVAIRYIEQEGAIDRLLSIIKMRDSDYDRSICELEITDHGIEISESRHPTQPSVPQPAAFERDKDRHW